MTDIYLTNTLTRKKEILTPIRKGKIGIYSCGPTVYWNQHIGHMYAYVQWDTLVRFFRFVGFQAEWVMNITDVGHMTSDEDLGEDKMEKGAKREGITVWNLADKYIQQFKDSMKLLNITPPDKQPRATEHIEDQINLIKKIEANGFTYVTKMGVVYDTSKFPDYAKFAKLNLSKQKQKSDVENDPDKKSPWDFLLWVTGNPKHIMQWDSPWGKGYPGWHIECTAMSTRYLGERFDIHTGGREHIAVHHTNEIAQGFAAFGHITANYWMHNAWLTAAGGEKMSKSLGNYVTAQELVEKGYDPIAMRYLILTSNYRKGLDFSWEALDGAQKALTNLREYIIAAKNNTRSSLSEDKNEKIESYSNQFINALANDLNTPQALAILWEVVKSNIPGEDKYDLLLTFDEVLGLGLKNVNVSVKIPSLKLKLSQHNVTIKTTRELSDDIISKIDQREQARMKGDFNTADKIRNILIKDNIDLDDTSTGVIVKDKK